MLLLYINRQLTDMDAGQVIAQTKQVNDLNSLENRQASYTNKFKLPKTANNIRIMDFLSITGNTSNIPYQKNECSLYSDTGECFVNNGWAVVTDSGSDYEVVVYDGIIDLYKMIENAPLSSLNLSALNHAKSLETIIASWDTTQQKPFRYILADYNGQNGRTNVPSGIPTVITNYLVPSVNVAWLWYQIFVAYGMTYSGSIFDTHDFNNLWMTYPKGTDEDDITTHVFQSSNLDHHTPPKGAPNDMYWRTLLFKYIDSVFINGTYLQADAETFCLKATEPGYYKIQLFGKLKTTDTVILFLAKNITSTSYQTLDSLATDDVFSVTLQRDTDFNHSAFVYLNANESVSVLMRQPFNYYNSNNFVRRKGNDGWGFTIDVTNVSSQQINFSEAFAEFPIKDFLSEVIHRYGLTLFKDKNSNHYNCLTIQEQLQTPGEIDLSKKFVKKISENYIHGNYAQNNWFRYSYNDKEETYNDAFIPVQNINLPGSKDIIKSKIYSPEKEKKRYLKRQTNVYKLWEKEVVENPEEGESPITYKALDKRFYFLRAQPIVKPIKLIKTGSPGTISISNIWVESFWKLSFSEIIKDYYQPIRQILDKTMVVTVELMLSDSDIANFNFKKLYYLEQLSSSFLMNKIINYVPGKPVKCEMIRIQNGLEDVVPAPAIKITEVITSGYYSTIYFDLNINTSIVTLQVSADAETTWLNKPMAASQSPCYYNFPGIGTYYIRMQAGKDTTPSYKVIIRNPKLIIKS